jgi:hypothetical protein
MENKNFSYENVFKSWFTTLLGCVIMAVCFYEWYKGEMTDMQAIMGGIIGFALLFMRDAIPTFISRFINKKIDQ